MDCMQFVELMSDYVDGDLSAEDAALWQKHFDECKNCAPFFKSFASSLDLVKYLKEQPCPREVRARMSKLIADLCDQKQAQT